MMCMVFDFRSQHSARAVRDVAPPRTACVITMRLRTILGCERSTLMKRLRACVAPPIGGEAQLLNPKLKIFIMGHYWIARQQIPCFLVIEIAHFSIRRFLTILGHINVSCNPNSQRRRLHTLSGAVYYILRG